MSDGKIVLLPGKLARRPAVQDAAERQGDPLPDPVTRGPACAGRWRTGHCLSFHPAPPLRLGTNAVCPGRAAVSRFSVNPAPVLRPRQAIDREMAIVYDGITSDGIFRQYGGDILTSQRKQAGMIGLGRQMRTERTKRVPPRIPAQDGPAGMGGAVPGYLLTPESRRFGQRKPSGKTVRT